MTRRSISTPLDAADLRGLERACSALSAIEREVLALSARRGLDNREIAARLGISERRAERLLARALRKFCRAIEARPRSRWRFWR